MNRCIPLILVFASVLLLSSCGSGRILYWFDNAYWSTIGGDDILRARLDAFALARAALPTLDLTRAGDPNPGEALSRALSTGRYATVVLGPLLSLDALQIARNHPSVRFILLRGARDSADMPANVTVVFFDRREAFRIAGNVAALVAAGQSSPQPGSRVGILSNAGSDLSAEEVDAFRDGVSSASVAGQPVTRALSDSPDAATIQAAVSEMNKNGVRVFLISLGSANPLALEALKTAGGSSVVADWSRSRLDPAQVLLSVETDDTAAIMKAVSSTGSSVVSGRVHLVLGDAGPIPDAARTLLNAQR